MAFTEDSDLQTFSDPTDELFLPLDANGNLLSPMEVSIGQYYPVYRSTGTNYMIQTETDKYRRYRFGIIYPPMTKEDANMLLGLFEKHKGALKPLYFPIPTNVFTTIGNKQKENGRTMLGMPVYDTYDLATGAHTGWLGDDEFMLVDALTDFFPAGLYVKFANHNTVYRTIRPAYREADNRILFKLNKPLEADINTTWIDISLPYIPVKVRLDMDSLSHGVSQTGLVSIGFDLIEEL